MFSSRTLIGNRFSYPLLILLLTSRKADRRDSSQSLLSRMIKKYIQLLHNSAGLALRAGRYLWREPRSGMLVLRMASWVIILSLLIRFLPLPRVLSLITPKHRQPTANDPIELQRKLAGLIDALLSIDVLVFTPTCWKRAPVLHRYLALNGIETRIVFGVRKEAEGLLEGHAWLEAEKEPILETDFPKYTVTYAFPH